MEMHPAQGAKVVTAAGTAETLIAATAADVWVSSLVIQAKKVGGDNTGNVFLGDSNLDMGVAEAIELTPGDSYEPYIQDGARINLKDIYVDADTSADGVTWLYWK